jgi:membrane protease YdiL (CAAX protease family)
VVWNEVLSVIFEFSGLYSNEPYLKLGWLRSLEVATLFILWGSYRMSIFGRPGQRFKDLLWGLGISVIGISTVYSCHLITVNFFNFDLWNNARSPDNSEPLLHLIFFGFLAGPLCEEVFFRATLWRQLKLECESWLIKMYGGLWTIAIFSGLHYRFDLTWQEQILSLFVWSSCGLLSFALYWWRRSVITPWIVHGCANAVILWPN